MILETWTHKQVWSVIQFLQIKRASKLTVIASWKRSMWMV